MDNDPLDFVDTEDPLFWPFVLATVGLVAFLGAMVLFFGSHVFFWSAGLLVGLFYALFMARMNWGEWF
jgi:hypothetical protein